LAVPAVNHYETLEVSPNAGPEVIRAAYKSLMQRFHPDKHPGDQAVALRATAIGQAYEVLSNDAARAEYDAGLRRVEAPVVPRQPRARPAAETRSFRFGWLLLFAIMGASVWVVVSLMAKKHDPAAELASIRAAFASATVGEARKRELYARKLEILERNPELLGAASAEKSADMAARTFALLDAPLEVRVGSDMPGGPAADARLTIRSASLLVGTFDAAELLAHMARHRERLVTDLSARLAKADPERLTGRDGEANLKRIVLESVAASLDTDPRRDYPSTYFESPGRYGVVDMLLPDPFTFVQLSSLR
jgi:hypothetical protein